MSFILDALRKSEIERKRDTAPDLMRSPIAPVRHVTPPWTGLLIGVLVLALALALAGLAASWWLRGRSDAATAATTEPAVTSAPVTAAPKDAAAPPAEPSAPPTADRPTPAAVASPGEPRPISDLVRADPDLPRYTLSFLDYNAAAPDRSSAWINGQRYYPGQVIVGGPELAGIRSDGALLTWRGQSYLLSTR